MTSTTTTQTQTRGHAGHHHHHDNTYLTSTDKTDPGVRITRIGLYVNLGMAIGKGVGGYVFNSQALTADAIHSLTDLVSDIMTLATVSWSMKTPTARFPSGYGKVESLGSLGVSGLLLTGGFLMGWTALVAICQQFFPEFAEVMHNLGLFGHDHHGHSHGPGSYLDKGPNINAAWLAGGSIVIKEWLYRATNKIAKEKKSSVLASNAYHHRVDSLTAFVALLMIGGSNLLSNAQWLDPVGGLIISLMVVQAGWSNTKTSLLELADVGVDDEMRGNVRRATTKALGELPSAQEILVRSVQGVKSGQNFLMDIELGVPSSWDMDQMRQVEDLVRARVGAKVRGVKRVRVRFVPAELGEPDFLDEFIAPAGSARASPEPEDHEHDHDHDHGNEHSHEHPNSIVVQSNLKLVHEAKVDFDADLSKYGIEKGVLQNQTEGEIFAPVAMWLEAIDLVLQRLKEDGLDFSRVKGVSGAGMQHGTVFWSQDAENLLGALNGEKSLLEQLEGSGTEKKAGEGRGAFSHPYSPNWQDASTQAQCDQFDKCLGSPEKLAEITGSKAHHRFSGPQILRFRQKYPDAYNKTARISLVSSFLASIFLGRVAPIDIGDVCGMNLWNINAGTWDESLLSLAAGSDGVAELKRKLGDVPEDGGAAFGTISQYYVSRYNFSPDCAIIPFTGDNPSTILALPLRESDAIVSLGTSTTFLMSTPRYKPDPAYHFMNHPTTRGLYMFMLCYKNGGLARERIRDALNAETPDQEDGSWTAFNNAATTTPPLGQKSPDDPMRLGLFFPRPEIVPNVRAGTWRFLFYPSSATLTPVAPNDPAWPTPPPTPARSQGLVSAQQSADGTELPPQPRRVYLVGGGSANPTIAELAGQVLGGAEGVYRLDIGGNACVCGGRWNEGAFVKKVAEGYREGVWEGYGAALKGFEEMEGRVLEEEGRETGAEEDPGSSLTRERDPEMGERD
ncbi:hypothetical protein H2199_004192 [Coniosporium tulheliwenetii]|uniref:Uncharacterized protein n=1 Tax=Coniosporium tulheliwenetii TaxID=3383036 RepID=A0ACC2Z7H6_9PEZI|nr:hypothetical protein H2199_004192 [Cladosporium sp. JES 115]